LVVLGSLDPHHDTIIGTTIRDSSLYADRQLSLVLSNAHCRAGGALEYNISSNSWSENGSDRTPHLANAPTLDPLHLAVGAWDIRTYQIAPKTVAAAFR